jgi:HEAT repeats
MAAGEQLDLFRVSPSRAEWDLPSGTAGRVTACDTLDDDSLLAAIPAAGMRETLALVAETGRRRLPAAIPVLEALCRRFAGFGADRIVPEQAAALDALVLIGGSDAAQTLARLIAKRIVQGRCLRQAVAAAARLEARLPLSAVMELLRHDEPQIRADACRCTRRWGAAVLLLRELLDDLHRDVRIAAACALGRMGRSEVRGLLVGYLREEPTAELIDAIAPIADDECIVLLGRLARSMPHLSECAIEALHSTDRPRADGIIAALRERA